MGYELDRIDPAANRGSLAVGGAGVDPGQGSDIRGVEFSAKAVVFDDLPVVFRSTAPQAVGTSTDLVVAAKPRGGELVAVDAKLVTSGSVRPVKPREVLASGARTLAKPRRAHGEVVSRMVGWQATPDRIVVTVADRALRKRDDGRFEPEPGARWAIEHRTSYEGTVTGRTGKVITDAAAAVAPARSSASAASAAPAGPAPVNPDFEAGLGALSFLPAPVRSSVLARVANPVLFDGSVHQYAHADGSTAHLQVDLLRMDYGTAIAVQGKLAMKPGSTSEYVDHWEVRQSVYALLPGRVEQA